ncbi:uncharacterized protein MELLADRAFT_102511 [Melampsora larici-populina 98AG31]|uniref:Uncharacterized protein n=1 Tax=Melampsora larici-populina (strain 98AG31 / pathotype 3-4-7) TaxID=747676 RepID=F4R8J8_MELLP|nr:uncharacterized protein MELLADRAFT_102511 [Melampsora larici-populina 98AG31]EGG11588.1 hypothetical protein MELLADRAFT_102511 [Melampsora larici-populina 98AG31]
MEPLQLSVHFRSTLYLGDQLQPDSSHRLAGPLYASDVFVCFNRPEYIPVTVMASGGSTVLEPDVPHFQSRTIVNFDVEYTLQRATMREIGLELFQIGDVLGLHGTLFGYDQTRDQWIVHRWCTVADNWPVRGHQRGGIVLQSHLFLAPLNGAHSYPNFLTQRRGMAHVHLLVSTDPASMELSSSSHTKPGTAPDQAASEPPGAPCRSSHIKLAANIHSFGSAEPDAKPGGSAPGQASAETQLAPPH